MKTLLLALLVMGSACATTVEDDLAGESATDGAVGGKADGAPDGVYTYFQLHAGAKGGWQLARLNRSTTVCANGSTAARCDVPTLDWSESALVERTQTKVTDAAATPGVHAIVRGRFARRGTAYRFIVTEAWLSETESQASGVFAKITLSGIQCITTPCPSLKEHSLNNSFTANIAEIDWSFASLTDRETEAFTAEIARSHGTIICGDRYNLSSTMKGRTATAAFHRLVEDAACYRGGCSDEVCSDRPGVITSCIWKPEDACYAQAACERQPDGDCGFTPDDALTSCLAGV